jgi:hypothetical protein
MVNDAEFDGMVDYAYWCMDQAGWKSVECPNCGCPRYQKGHILEQCPECGDEETDLSMIRPVP